ncbi:universal stress protein [Xylophilus sp.]|uniref:universal stress protein n=1 Tax=Xylophilus sp. TaxID=2653893 RepID=UPI0013B801E3|nr:universal stress protein [Xylophilus sp.]KAF1043737.1 MAG: Stress response protein NhaX [Xylophilus sp.]
MHVLLPIDGTELSLRAVRYAIGLHHQGLQLRVLLANVQEPSNFYELVNAPDPAVREKISAEAGRHLLAQAQALLREACIAHVDAVAHGDPAQALIELAETNGIDLIVIGGHGKGLLRSAIEGSVSLKLLQEAKVPVLVVKAPLAA